jgi:hypothetical protein
MILFPPMIPLILILKFLKKNLERLTWSQNSKEFLTIPSLSILQKNWYSRPTPPDLQFEERFLQSKFSVSSDKLYEWNIDGLSEQELMNEMNHMSMVANAYDTNQNLSQSEIVDLLAMDFLELLKIGGTNISLKIPEKKLEKLSKRLKMAYPFLMKKLVEANLIVLIL